jgi:MoxR-like ATPase
MTTNLMALPIRTVIDAYNSRTGEGLPYTAADKIKAATWLANQGHTPGSLTGAEPKGAPMRPTPAAAAGTATTAQVEQRILSLGAEVQRLNDTLGSHMRSVTREADEIATRVLDLSDNLKAEQQTAAGLRGSMATLIERMDEAETLARKATQAPAAPVLDKNEARSILVDEMRKAWAPFHDAVTAAGAQAAVAAQAAATVVARKPAKEVFGIEAKDRKGNELLFDVYDDPTAPTVDNCHIWTDRMVRLLWQAQERGANGNLWLGGLRGAGKTMTMQQFAARTGRAFCRVNFHQHTSADEYIGATGLANGATVFQPADFLMAYTRPGAVICLDEITNCHPGSLAPLNGLLEPNARVSIGGRLWTRAPGVVIAAADNTTGAGDASGRHAGTREMNSALMDRFAFKPWLEFLPRDVERKALIDRTGANPKLVDHVLDAVDKCRAKVQTGEIIDPPSIRSVGAFILALATEDVREAWNITIAAAQPAESAVGLEAIFTTCIDPKTINKHI